MPQPPHHTVQKLNLLIRLVHVPTYEVMSRLLDLRIWRFEIDRSDSDSDMFFTPPKFGDFHVDVMAFFGRRWELS
jgi:hypothetical protein